MAVCLCGCGTSCTRDFAPGHDSRFKGMLKDRHFVPNEAQVLFLKRKAFATVITQEELTAVVRSEVQRQAPPAYGKGRDDGPLSSTDQGFGSSPKGETRDTRAVPHLSRFEVEQAAAKVFNDGMGVLLDKMGTTNRALIEKLVIEEAKRALAPQTVTIEVKIPEGVKVLKDAHYLMPRLVTLLGAGFHVYLWGPAGSGKTTAAQQVATALSRGSEIDTMDPSTFRSMVQGFVSPAGDPIGTSFTRCWEQGLVYIADEVDNAPGHVQTLFNSALANGHAPLAWGNVAKHEGFGFVGTGNTPGRPTRAFPDRRPMSAAFADRLYFMHWPLDPAIECRAAGLPIPPTPDRKDETCTPERWVSFVQRLRAWSEVNMPTLMVTPRASLAGMKALALGETPDEVADGLIFRGCDDEMRRKALQAVRW